MATQQNATKANLMALKKSLALAQNGYELLDRKRNILVRETMAFTHQAAGVQEELHQLFADAYTCLQLANVTLGNCEKLAQSVPTEQGLTIRSRSVMGVELPLIFLSPQPTQNYYGFASSNSYLDDAYQKFNQIKLLTAKLAQIESSVTRLADAIGKTQKRANALKNIVIPRFEQQIAHINEVLEEKELEEHSRLQVIKSQKQK